MKKNKWPEFLLLLALSAAATAQELQWETNFTQASLKAKKSGFYMLLDFTGSDWCKWCILLDNEVFKKPEFIKFANENLVCVLLDFPRTRPQPQELKEKNEALAQKYDVRGYPTIIILAPDGSFVAKTGYQKGGATNYVKHLTGLIEPHKWQSVGPSVSLGCGPWSVYCSFVRGKPELRAMAEALPGNTPEERVKELIRRYGAKPSKAYAGKRTIFSEIGMTPTDLPEFINDWLSEHCTLKTAGYFLDRKKDEPQEQHLRRVYRYLRQSLDSGFPPIISVTAFAARPSGQNYVWDSLAGHFISVVELQPELSDTDKFFWFKYVEAPDGRVETAVAALEQSRPFTATRNFSIPPSGSLEHLDWEWVTGYPYLVVTDPSLGLGTGGEPWYMRTTVVLRHAVCLEVPAPVHSQEVSR